MVESGQTVRRLFSVADYYRMGEAGVFESGDRLELIEGEIYETTPIGSSHAACVDRLNMLLTRLGGGRAIVRVQGPVRLDEFSEPEPDLALLRPRNDYYANAHPGPGDVLLIIEVADTSLVYDREVKVPLYARAGIAEVWVVNVAEKHVETYSHPAGGTYTTQRAFRTGDSVTPQTLSDLVLSVDSVLGL
jgi:Uma2 family endonuclease